MTVLVRTPEVRTEPLGGAALARLAQDGSVDLPWYLRRPRGLDEWKRYAQWVCGTASAGWYEKLHAACDPRDAAARARLTRAIDGHGIVVTTGQQPGLFGGPVYTWSKAISALALADEVEEVTGIPSVPVFWAATDDSDFAEASSTWLTLPGGATRLMLSGAADEGSRLADVPLGDVEDLLEALRSASGSAMDPRPLDAVRRAYVPGATVGGAYVRLLRDLLEPMGIVVLDSANSAVSEAAHQWLVQALVEHERIGASLQARSAELQERGFDPQVADVDGRTLVFERVGVRRERVSHNRAAAAAAAEPGTLSPNVLLRPVIERSLLPTVAYLAGPGELAYFAQVSAVAAAMGRDVPLALPRWSGTIIEPHIADLLDQYRLTVGDFADPHSVETRLARDSWPESVARAYGEWVEEISRQAARLREALDGGEGRLLPRGVVDGAERSMTWRLSRLERRLTSAVKRREQRLMHDLGTLRGALYPGGIRQERAMNLIPTLTRHGVEVLDRMRVRAREYARGLVRGEVGGPSHQ